MDILEHRGFLCVPQADKHHPALVQLLCDELEVKSDALLDFELCLADTQPAVSPLRRINSTVDEGSFVQLCLILSHCI